MGKCDFCDKIYQFFSGLLDKPGVPYWKRRVKFYGRRAVVNIRYGEDELDGLTEQQKKDLFPYLRKALSGKDKMIVDYGCGNGRFTPDLAGMTSGKAIGLDPVYELLQMAPRNENVDYIHFDGENAPLKDGSADAVWISLTLGAIPDSKLTKVKNELCRILKKGGLVFLAENTSPKPLSGIWINRSPDFYRSLFDFAAMEYAGEYYDSDERISVMYGRKK